MSAVNTGHAQGSNGRRYSLSNLLARTSSLIDSLNPPHPTPVPADAAGAPSSSALVHPQPKISDLLRLELGNWWNGSTNPHHETVYAAIDTNSGRPPLQRRNSDEGRSQSREPNPFYPPNDYAAQANPRSHLYYRDAPHQASSTIYPTSSSSFTPLREYDTRYPGSSVGTPESPVSFGVGSIKEQEAIREAVIESQREAELARSRTIIEDQELQRALAASIESSRQPVDPITPDSRRTSQSILEARRQTLLEQQLQHQRSSHPTRSRARSDPPPPSAQPTSQPDWQESEWRLLERNEKGQLFREGGAHGWLPAGATTGRDEDQREREMIELAIQLSLCDAVERDEARAAVEEVDRSGQFSEACPQPHSPPPPPLPPRSRVDTIGSHPAPSTSSLRSTEGSYDTALSNLSPSISRDSSTAASFISSPSSPSPRSIPRPPSRPVPPIPRDISFIAPSQPKIFSHSIEVASDSQSHSQPESVSAGVVKEEAEDDRRRRTGSPFEQPSLTPASSLRSPLQINDDRADTDSDSGTQHEFEPQSDGTGKFIDPRGSIPLLMDRASSSKVEGGKMSNTSVATQPPIRDLGRSLSLVREQTEGFDDPTRSMAATAVESKVRILDEGEIGEVVAEEGGGIVEDGVRFGYSQLECGTFPSQIELSTFDIEDGVPRRRKFTIEARTMNSLMRVLLWFGDIVIFASDRDISASTTRHCDAAIRLEFRTNERLIPVIRLTIELYSPTFRRAQDDLTLLESSSSSNKGDIIKGKGRSIDSIKIFSLPDHAVLPARLSTLAITLYTLRHLASIALNTQPSKAASASYRALQKLAESILTLAKEYEDSMNNSAESTKLEQGGDGDERLLGRLRERLRLWKPRQQATSHHPSSSISNEAAAASSSSSVSSQGGAGKLVKPPPTAGRTTTIRRDVRVLSDDDAEDEQAQS